MSKAQPSQARKQVCGNLLLESYVAKLSVQRAAPCKQILRHAAVCGVASCFRTVLQVRFFKVNFQNQKILDYALNNYGA